MPGVFLPFTRFGKKAINAVPARGGQLIFDTVGFVLNGLLGYGPQGGSPA